jgi:trk system potassium uptake protein
LARMKKKQFAVLGLGQFGTVLACELHSLGHDVLVMDKSEDKVNKISAKVTHAIQGDITNEDVLRSLGFANFDEVIVASSQNIQSSLMACLILKEQGVKKLVAKASTELHGKVLAKIGVDNVVFPESDMASKLAQSMTSASIIDYIEVSDEFNIAELGVPASVHGLTLLKANLREKYGLNVLAIIKGRETNLSPKASDVLNKDDKIVVIGHKDAINRFDAN